MLTDDKILLCCALFTNFQTEAKYFILTTQTEY